MLSHYCRKIKQKFNINSVNVQKLIPALYDKENYVLHEENLKLYLKLGLKFKKSATSPAIQRKPWLKKYIDFHTEMRKNAKYDFEKRLF